MKTLKCCSTWNLEYNFRHQLYCFRQIHITAIKNILKLKNASCSILECVMLSLIFLARIAFGPPLGGGLNKKLTRCARLGFFLVRFRVQARTAPNKKSQHFRASFLFVGKTGFEPATPWSQTRCATGLRYFPNFGMNRIFSTAVRAGFEPAVQFNPYGSLANY